jgi:hypothetical protein
MTPPDDRARTDPAALSTTEEAEADLERSHRRQTRARAIQEIGAVVVTLDWLARNDDVEARPHWADAQQLVRMAERHLARHLPASKDPG